MTLTQVSIGFALNFLWLLAYYYFDEETCLNMFKVNMFGLTLFAIGAIGKLLL